MSQRKATGAVAAPVIPDDGVIRFEDGDFVKITIRPTQRQRAAVVRAALLMEGDPAKIIDVQNGTIAAVAYAGELHAANPDGTRGPALSWPLDPEALLDVEGEKLDRLLEAAVSVKDLVPNPKRLTASLGKS